MKSLLTWKLIGYLLVGPIVGLLLCRLVDHFAFSGKQRLDQTAAGLLVLQLLAGIFGCTAIILVPLRVFWDRHEVRETANDLAEAGFDPDVLPPVERHLFYMHYGSVPRWLYLPFVIVAAVLGGILALGIVAFIVLGLVWAVLHMYMHFFGA